MPAYVSNGHVYLLECMETGLFKVGCTYDLYLRMCAIRNQSANSLRLVWHIGTNDGLRLEGWFHDRWDRYRIRGEWFSLTSEHVAFFKSASVVNYVGRPPLPPAMRDPLRERRTTNTGRRRENVVAVGEVLRKMRRY